MRLSLSAQDTVWLNRQGEFREIEIENVCRMVSPGWCSLVQDLIRDLFAVGWDGRILQVKQKFGGLRFYVDVMSAEMFSIIHAAQEKSLSICEECGEPGELVDEDGYLVVKCERHVESAEREQD